MLKCVVAVWQGLAVAVAGVAGGGSQLLFGSTSSYLWPAAVEAMNKCRHGVASADTFQEGDWLQLHCSMLPQLLLLLLLLITMMRKHHLKRKRQNEMMTVLTRVKKRSDLHRRTLIASAEHEGRFIAVQHGVYLAKLCLLFALVILQCGGQRGLLCAWSTNSVGSGAAACMAPRMPPPPPLLLLPSLPLVPLPTPLVSMVLLLPLPAPLRLLPPLLLQRATV